MCLVSVGPTRRKGGARVCFPICLTVAALLSTDRQGWDGSQLTRKGDYTFNRKITKEEAIGGIAGRLS